MAVERDVSLHPMVDLIRQLPYCEVTAAGEIDYDASDPELIQPMGECAARVMATAHRGIVAIGLLLAHAAPEIEAGSLPADIVADLGNLLAELACLAARCDLIATHCRQVTADYSPESETSNAAADE